MNAFRGQTCEELIHAFGNAGWDKSIGVIVLGGAGDRAFCTGGDQSAHDGQYDGRGMIGLPVEDLHGAHPRRAEAGDRPRAGLCDRRRQRAGDAVRPDHCVRESSLRPGRTKGGIG